MDDEQVNNPKDMPGIDVSSYQETIDWHDAKSKGVEFVYCKATEGVGYKDSYFKANHDGAKAVGIPFGAYHFFHPGTDSNQQAKFFLETISGYEGQLIPMVDFETTDGIEIPNLLAARLAVFNSAIEKTLNGKKILIYTYFDFWNVQMAGSSDFSGHPLAIAEYNHGTAPDLPSGWKSWTVWQHSSQGSIFGINGNVDLDELNGKNITVIER